MSDKKIEMKPVASNKYTKALAKVCQWDPNEDSLTPAIDIDAAAIVRIACDKVKDEGRETDFTAVSKLTLYKTLDGHPMSNLYLYITGQTGSDELLEKTKMETLSDSKKKPYIYGDTIEGYVELLRSIQIEVQGLAKSEVVTPIGTLKMPEDDGVTEAINKLLTSVSLPELEPTFEMIGGLVENVEQQGSLIKEQKKDITTAQKEIKRLSDEMFILSQRVLLSSVAKTVAIKASHDGTMPEGKIVYRKASELFPDITMSSDFEVPTFDWDGVHPNVPVVDPHYVFRAKELVRILYAIALNKRAWLQGHTGSGKTTLVEQVAARLNYPVLRVNFDSEITRGELMGRDTLTVNGEGATVSKFIDGILPAAMVQPCIFLADELDFVRPDVSYVLQAVLEGNALRLAEDGDRRIEPHPMFRVLATANTKGQGDEHGMYQGARAQSLALLDRIAVWVEVQYMNDKERDMLVSSAYPMLKADDKKSLLSYVKEHLKGFENGNIIQPISPRGMLAIAEATAIMGDIKTAFEMVVIDKASSDDRATLKEIVDRVTK